MNKINDVYLKVQENFGHASEDPKKKNLNDITAAANETPATELKLGS